MIVHESGISRLLASSPFRRSRLVAASLVDDPEGLQCLLTGVEEHRFGTVPAGELARGVDLDIACAVVEARIEELHEGHPATTYTCAQDARLRLVVAALHYLVTEHDVIPDSAPAGHLDDVAILRWVTRVAQGELPVTP